MPTPTELLFQRLRTIATEASATAAYPKWDNAFSRKSIKSQWESKGELTIADIRGVLPETLSALGFGVWEDGFRLIPLWAYNAIVDGEELTSIDGEKKIKGQDEIDFDIRFGCIAWGFTTNA